MSPIGQWSPVPSPFRDPKYLDSILNAMHLGAPRYGATDIAHLPVSPSTMLSPDAYRRTSAPGVGSSPKAAGATSSSFASPQINAAAPPAAAASILRGRSTACPSRRPGTPHSRRGLRTTRGVDTTSPSATP